MTGLKLSDLFLGFMIVIGNVAQYTTTAIADAANLMSVTSSNYTCICFRHETNLNNFKDSWIY